MAEEEVGQHYAGGEKISGQDAHQESAASSAGPWNITSARKNTSKPAKNTTSHHETRLAPRSHDQPCGRDADEVERGNVEQAVLDHHQRLGDRRQLDVGGAEEEDGCQQRRRLERVVAGPVEDEEPEGDRGCREESRHGAVPEDASARRPRDSPPRDPRSSTRPADRRVVAVVAARPAEEDGAEHRHQVEPGAHPHQQTAELLVGQRGQAPGMRSLRIPPAARCRRRGYRPSRTRVGLGRQMRVPPERRRRRATGRRRAPPATEGTASPVFVGPASVGRAHRSRLPSQTLAVTFRPLRT